MDEAQEPAEQRDQGTLGDVLYAKHSGPLVSEQEWAGLVRSIAAGDQLALHALYERAHRLVFTLAVRITGNRENAEELTVDVFYDVWRRASGYDPRNGTVLGWIMNQARSRSIDRLRFEHRKKRLDPNPALEPETAIDGHDALEAKAQNRTVQDALKVLTPSERQAVGATFFSGLTHAEAAQRLGEPLGTVKTRIRSALQKLRAVLSAAKNES